MPAVSSELKDLMCYQINKFERTMSGTVPLGELNMNLVDKSSDANNALYQNLPTSPIHHHPFHYCPEYESQVKRSRSIRFGSGGDVIIDKNHGYANVTSPPPLREKVSRPSLNLSPNIVSSSQNNRNSITISLNLSEPFDLDTFLKTHDLSISINVVQKKDIRGGVTTTTGGSGTDLRSAIDEFNRNLLRKSGWYYQNVDWQESRRILKNCSIGTFLVRDSGDPRFSFSLSVQTLKGPISTRISYSNGQYRLDAQDVDELKMPAFTTIIALIEHYIKNGLVKSSVGTGGSGRQVWVDHTGQVCSPVQMTKPKLKEVGNLGHLCRLVLNGSPSQLKSHQAQVPGSIQSYLEEYPFTV